MVLASNLLCRLPSPRKFLKDIKHFIAPGGVLVLISPYSWLEEYTSLSEWIGGVEGTEARGADTDKSSDVTSAGNSLERYYM